MLSGVRLLDADILGLPIDPKTLKWKHLTLHNNPEDRRLQYNSGENLTRGGGGNKPKKTEFCFINVWTSN